jgi:signal transduction histidine kinase
MSFRTWPVAAAALLGLLALIAAFGVATTRRSSSNDQRMEALYRHHRAVDEQFHRLRSDVHLSSIFIRDYLLDTAGTDPVYREQLAAYRRSNMKALDELLRLIPTSGEVRDRTRKLTEGLDKYWEAFAPLFSWTPQQKSSEAVRFLRQEVVPRRDEVLAIAKEIEDLNSASLDQERQETSRQAASHLDDLQTLLWQTLGLGLVVSAVSINRFRALELRTEQEHALAEAATAQTRALSMQLVATQEEERRKISRELHDDIGQMLTGIRMELGRLERVGGDPAALGVAIAESRALLEDVVRSVRDLAMGLRPSMLDDFGLQPALEWLVRDFSRRSRLKVSSSISGNLSHLGDSHSTCVFRTVQETLTNCVRHAEATQVSVKVTGSNGDVTVEISDNGVGIPAKRRKAGLGLRGLEERARELQGTLTIDSEPAKGTTITLWLPVPAVH